MSDFPRLSNKELVILALLTQRGASYGLAMVKASEGRLKRGTIYVTLDRMEDKGYVESWLEESGAGEQGPPRRMYKITGYGARAYDLWRLWGESKSGGTKLALGLGGAM